MKFSGVAVNPSSACLPSGKRRGSGTYLLAKKVL